MTTDYQIRRCFDVISLLNERIISIKEDYSSGRYRASDGESLKRQAVRLASMATVLDGTVLMYIDYVGPRA